MGRLGRTANVPTTASFGRIDPTNTTVNLRLGRAVGGVCFISGLPLSPLTYTCIHTHNTSHVSSCNSFVTLDSIYSRTATHFVGHRISSNIVTPKCASRTLTVLERGHGKACGIVRVDPNCGPTPVRRGSIFNVAFRRKHGRVGLGKSRLFTGVPAQGGGFPRTTGHSLVVTLVALGCARSGSMYCIGSNRTVNVNTNRRDHVRYAHLTNGGTSV